jgi:hypothetical protein
MTDDLPFRVVRSNGTDELLAQTATLIARGEVRVTAAEYPRTWSSCGCVHW